MEPFWPFWREKPEKNVQFESKSGLIYVLMLYSLTFAFLTVFAAFGDFVALALGGFLAFGSLGGLAAFLAACFFFFSMSFNWSSSLYREMSTAIKWKILRNQNLNASSTYTVWKSILKRYHDF